MGGSNPETPLVTPVVRVLHILFDVVSSETFLLCFFFYFTFSYCFQARKKWNTKHDNGTKNASLAAFAKIRLVRSLLYRKNRKSIAPAAMKRNMRPDASNVTKYEKIS